MQSKERAFMGTAKLTIPQQYRGMKVPHSACIPVSIRYAKYAYYVLPHLLVILSNNGHANISFSVLARCNPKLGPPPIDKYMSKRHRLMANQIGPFGLSKENLKNMYSTVVVPNWYYQSVLFCIVQHYFVL